MSFLTMEDVTFRYQGKHPVIQHINWEMKQGEFHCLLGRSGCGKTTLLKLAAGLLQADTGRIHLQGSEITKPSLECGFVFQSPNLLEWKTVTENVLLPIKLKRKVTGKDRTQALELLELVGLASYSDQYPLQLSGGQQSRVAIVRALIQKPSLLLMDEPFAALDAITKEELQDELLQLCHLHNMTVLFITHDISEAVYLADVVGVMDKGEIVYQSTVELQRRRNMQVRYESYFNELCFKLRQVMGGVTP